MGNQKQRSWALVSMTNKDVYYVTVEFAKRVMAAIAEPGAPAFFETIDMKSGARIAIATSNISSVIIPEGFKQVGGRDV